VSSVCCNVLQCGGCLVCCSVLQYLQCGECAFFCSVLVYVIGVLVDTHVCSTPGVQRVAVGCSPQAYTPCMACIFSNKKNLNLFSVFQKRELCCLSVCVCVCVCVCNSADIQAALFLIMTKIFCAHSRCVSFPTLQQIATHQRHCNAL